MKGRPPMDGDPSHWRETQSTPMFRAFEALEVVARTSWSVACRIVPDHGGRGSRAADAATPRVAAAMAAWGGMARGSRQTGEPRPMHACDGRKPATGGESSCHLLATRLVLTVCWRTSSRQK